MDKLTRALRALFHADTLIATIWLRVVGRQAALFVIAGLTAIFGLGLLNVAGYLAIAPIISPIWAALGMAGADLLIAALVLSIAVRAKPGRDLGLALELRDNAIENLSMLARNPLALAGNALVVPLLTGLVKGLRPKK
jgi:hypothetical protein